MTNIPNSAGRSSILFILVFVILFYLPSSVVPHGGVAIVLILAAATDWFDGYLACKS